MTLVDKIKKFFAESDSPVLFAGAGVSVRAGLPSWRAYLTTLAGVANDFDFGTKFQMDQKIAEGKFALAASYFFLCDGIPEATRLKELTTPLENYDASKLIDLASLPFTSIVTTNYDEAILDAYASARGKAPRSVNIDEPSLSAALWESKFYIARIHGRVELPTSIRLTQEHFRDLSFNDPYKEFLTYVLTRCNVMFVGFSFLDPAISSVMRAVKATYKNLHGRQHLALLPSDAASEFIKELEAHDIQRVSYSPGAGHLELWRAISQALMTVSKKAGTSIVSSPFALTKRYLATAYARMKIGASKSGPLLHVMSEGMVSGMINEAHSEGITETELIEGIFQALPVSREDAQAVVSRSVAALLAEGLCKGVKADNQIKISFARPCG